jgi:6-phosphogluconolactonase (cycloisomerase 2 family)
MLRKIEVRFEDTYGTYEVVSEEVFSGRKEPATGGNFTTARRTLSLNSQQNLNADTAQGKGGNRQMRLHRTFVCGFLLLLGLLTNLQAQSIYVYTNDSPGFGPNTVSALRLNTDNTLSPIAGTPFYTGGSGGSGFYGSLRNALSPDGQFLFASNAGSGDVSVFSINPSDGVLMLLPGSPFPTGGSGVVGISLSVTPDGKFLYASDAGSNTITAFRVSSHGSLTMVGSPIAAGGAPDGTKVTPDGKFLAVALASGNQVAMFDIGPDGSLTPVHGSPFTGLGSGIITSVEVNCGGNLLFADSLTSTATVQVFGIDADGVLGSIAGSPFQAGVGDGSNVVLLSPDNSTLFNSNQFTNGGAGSITDFHVAADGSLSLVLGSPFTTTGGLIPSGMAISRDGSLLFVANLSSKVGVFTVGSDGTLTQVPGSPFATGHNVGFSALVAWPPATCNTRNNMK